MKSPIPDAFLSAQVLEIFKSHPIPEWIRLQALPHLASTLLNKHGCVSISFLNDGSFNTVYKLVFSDNSTIVARISLFDESQISLDVRRSELATMDFVRESGLYPDIPMPEIHASDVSFSNPIGAPYVLMDLAEGVMLHDGPNTKEYFPMYKLDDLSPENQKLVAGALAKLQASLARPVPFNEIDSIYRDRGCEAPTSQSAFTIGPLATNEISLGGPYKSITEMWYSLVERWTDYALQSFVDREHSRDNLPDCPFFLKASPHRFFELSQQLTALIPHFLPPSSCLSLVLHHPDLALRNVFFDPEDYSKITAVIDWGATQVVPLILAARYPADLNSTADYPFARVAVAREEWDTVPYDWTYHKRMESARVKHRLEIEVGRFYLRNFYSNRFARARHELHGDTDPLRATIFAHAAYYMRFHELLCSHYQQWFRHEEWIEETFARMTVVGCHGGKKLIVGPNVYMGEMEKMFCDLGFVEASSSGLTRDDDEEYV